MSASLFLNTFTYVVRPIQLAVFRNVVLGASYRARFSLFSALTFPKYSLDVVGICDVLIFSVWPRALHLVHLYRALMVGPAQRAVISAGNVMDIHFGSYSGTNSYRSGVSGRLLGSHRCVVHVLLKSPRRNRTMFHTCSFLN